MFYNIFYYPLIGNSFSYSKHTSTNILWYLCYNDNKKLNNNNNNVYNNWLINYLLEG